MIGYGCQYCVGISIVNFVVLFLQEAKERKKRKEMGWDDEYLVTKEMITYKK